MGNLYLGPLFKAVYDHPFVQEFDSRMEMQKAVYLLEEMGVPVGGYGFYWYKHGPYSQSLQNDILSISAEPDVPFSISVDNNKSIKLLHDLMSKSVEYPTSNWAEGLASLHYIKKNLLPKSASDEDVVNELEKRKPHLDNVELNMQALHDLSSLFAENKR